MWKEYFKAGQVTHENMAHAHSTLGTEVYKHTLSSVALVRERTIPTERPPPPVGEVSANFYG